MRSAFDRRIVELYVERGLSLASTGREVGVSPSTVHRHLVLLGVPRQPPVMPVGTQTAKVPPEERARTVELYVERGLSIKQIGELMYLSRTAVYARLKRAGVRLRPPGQHAYEDGRRFPGHAAMDKTVQLYRAGLSTTEVGELLGIAASTTCRRLQRAGVPRRPRGESMRIRVARRRPSEDGAIRG